MGDYKVVYRTREVDVDEDRPRRRVTGALDPYRYPEDREELKRGVAEAKTRVARKYRVDSHRDFDDTPSRVERDDYSSVSIRQRERDGSRSTRKTYSVRDDHLERETEVGVSRPSRSSEIRERDIEIDRNERVSLAGSLRREDREFESSDIEVDRKRRSRRGPYVIETRPGYDVEIVRGGHREHDRSRVESPYVREVDTRKTEIVRESRDSPRSSSRLIEVDGPPYASGARSRDEVIEERDFESRTSIRGAKRASTRIEEDDVVVVDKKASRAPSVHGTFTDPFEGSHTPDRGRSRAATLKSDDGFVIVSPARSGRQRENSEGPLRSAMYDPGNYTQEEIKTRRRSRSISFREKEARNHDAGDQLHERPGTEAAMMGRYLNHYDVDDREDHRRESKERMNFEYHDVVRDNRGYSRHNTEDARYPPQRIHRDRSRRRRDRERERESDDESYVSRNVEKTTKYTYY